MKQAILNLKKKLLLVELPEGITDVHINKEVYKNKVSYRTQTSLHFIETKEDLLSDNCEIIGKLTDITESQFAEWVDKFNNGAFRNYKDEYPFYPDFDTDNFFLTAKESFFSYLEKEEILFSNPLGKRPKRMVAFMEADFYTENDLEEIREYEILLKEWQEAESKVWDINKCYLFQILK